MDWKTWNWIGILVALGCETPCLVAGDYAAVTNPLGTFHLYRARPEEISLCWKGKDGVPLRTFQAVEAHLRQQRKTPVFLMNAGIFEMGGVPSGLHVEDGQQLRPLNLADGFGNFYLKPNGVFYVDASGAKVAEVEAYAKSGAKPRLALQSGPLLLIHGRPHPRFIPDSGSRLHRNGVGILPDGQVLFAITDFAKTRVNLFEFAQLFRRYGCQDALFLDGDLSVMELTQAGQLPLLAAGDRESQALEPGFRSGNHFGAILAVTIEAK